MLNVILCGFNVIGVSVGVILIRSYSDRDMINSYTCHQLLIHTIALMNYTTVGNTSVMTCW